MTADRTAAALWAEIEAGLEGVPPGPWNTSHDDPFVVEDEGDLALFTALKRQGYEASAAPE